jgi:hypothetical protein
LADYAMPSDEPTAPEPFSLDEDLAGGQKSLSDWKGFFLVFFLIFV